LVIPNYSITYGVFNYTLFLTQSKAKRVLNYSILLPKLNFSQFWWLIVLELFNQSLNIILQVDYLNIGAVPTIGFAVWGYNKLFKVRRDVISADRRPSNIYSWVDEGVEIVAGQRKAFSEETEERMSIFTI